METIGKGCRASPSLRVVTNAGSVTATMKDFWQNFPKALRWEDGILSIGLFPRECSAPFELQGGGAEAPRRVVRIWSRAERSDERAAAAPPGRVDRSALGRSHAHGPLLCSSRA